MKNGTRARTRPVTDGGLRGVGEEDDDDDDDAAAAAAGGKAVAEEDEGATIIYLDG